MGAHFLRFPSLIFSKLATHCLILERVANGKLWGIRMRGLSAYTLHIKRTTINYIMSKKDEAGN